MGALIALVELLDRDGHVRQSVPVRRWPLRIGRAFDNDVVLPDPHVAAEHLRIASDELGLFLSVGATRNGVRLGPSLLASGARVPLTAEHGPTELTVGRTRIRLHLAGAALAPEQPLLPGVSLARRVAPVGAAALALLAGLLFTVYLDTDPDNLLQAAGGMLLSTFVGAALWCGAWALLSKTFTRQARFGWHLKVMLFSALALMVATALPALLAFALSWPALTNYMFVLGILVAAAALYYHLLAVEPAHHRLLRWAATGCAVVGIALSMWFNQQRGDRLGAELYMNHLFPPALRLARPLATDTFVADLAALKPTLDRKAREPDHGEAGNGGSDDE